MGSTRSILTTARSDPVGAGIVVSAVVLLGLATAYLADVPARIEAVARPWLAARPGPQAWLDAAHPGDRLTVPGYSVAFWGNPAASYGRAATSAAEPITAIVVHHTADHPILSLVKYGHGVDEVRGGSYGYHVYVDRAGRIVQGAPLSRRTNHVKPVGHAMRKPAFANVWNANSIGVSMVGGCVLKPNGAATEACSREDLTPPQLEAGLAVVRELMQRFNVPCLMVAGHGELQRDREVFEGQTIATLIRACQSKTPG